MRMMPGARPSDAGLEATARADLPRGSSIVTRSAMPGRSVVRGLKDGRARTCAGCSPSPSPTDECCSIGVDRELVRTPFAWFIKADRATLAQRPGMPTGRRAGHQLPRRRAVTSWPAPLRIPSACVPELPRLPGTNKDDHRPYRCDGAAGFACRGKSRSHRTLPTLAVRIAFRDPNRAPRGGRPVAGFRS
jgi:hypothetical protein